MSDGALQLVLGLEAVPNVGANHVQRIGTRVLHLQHVAQDGVALVVVERLETYSSRGQGADADCCLETDHVFPRPGPLTLYRIRLQYSECTVSVTVSISRRTGMAPCATRASS